MDNTTDEEAFRLWWATEIDGKRKIMELTHQESYAAGRKGSLEEIKHLKDLNESLKGALITYKAMYDSVVPPLQAKAELVDRMGELLQTCYWKERQHEMALAREQVLSAYEVRRMNAKGEN